MRNRKRTKTIDDYSVSQLLDDFLSPDTLDTSRPSKDIDDEEYIRMMLKKDAKMQLERTKRESHIPKHEATRSSRIDAIDAKLKQRFFPDVEEKFGEKEVPQAVKEKVPEKRVIPPEKK